MWWRSSRRASWCRSAGQMRRQRCGPAVQHCRCGLVRADVAMAILTMHHWDDWAAGLAELSRVAPRRVVLTMDFEMHLALLVPGESTCPRWVCSHGPRSRGTRRWPRSSAVAGGWRLVPLAAVQISVIPLLVPRDMQDGVLGAYSCRPEAYLGPRGTGELLRTGVGGPGRRRSRCGGIGGGPDQR